MNKDIIYFFTKEFIEKNQDKFTKCPCNQPGCSFLIYNNIEVPPLESRQPNNIIHVDFISKKRIA